MRGGCRSIPVCVVVSVTVPDVDADVPVSDANAEVLVVPLEVGVDLVLDVGEVGVRRVVDVVSLR